MELGKMVIENRKQLNEKKFPGRSVLIMARVSRDKSKMCRNSPEWKERNY
jgi:hypothetical protein